MSRRVGLELTGDRIRAVTVSQWRTSPHESFEIRWDPRVPDDAMTVLRQHLGPVTGIGVSVGLEFLHAKHVKLPPVSVAERRRILMLEPDRFFPIEGGEVVVSVGDDSDIVFAADAGMLDLWIAAIERWGPVENVEASPISLTRAMRAAGWGNGSFALPAATEEYGIAELRDGKLVSARRLADRNGMVPAKNPPAVRGVASAFVPAFGAALGAGESLDSMLVSDAAHARMRRRRTAGVTRAVINFVLALAFALAALDRSRSRALQAVEREIVAVTPRAAGGASLQARLASMDVELAAAQNVLSARVNPVSVLAALSRRLPPGATAMSVRADGNEWQIDGTARDAGALIPALAEDPRFADVRFLSASSRFRDAGRTYETFSIALRAVP
ncbi:MAG: PilN domain-containing protein [Gemmatimonadaceae bacterium]